MIKSYLVNEATDPTRFYDLALLKQIIAVQSKSDVRYGKAPTSDGDSMMIDMIESVIASISRFTKSEILVEKDTYGNIYATKGKAKSYPCVVSHTDTVHPIITGRRVYQQNDILFCFSDVKKKQVGTGGDDKVGIFVNLQALIDFDNIKAVFFRNEEIGHLGSKHSITYKKEFYKDCNFILQCDRKGNDDFLTTSAGIKLSSTNFINNVKPYVEKYGFTVRDIGISTDVDTLVEYGVGVSCVNISSGYHNPHMDSEVINVKEVGKTYSLVYDIIENLGNVKFPHKYTPKPFKNTKPKSKYSSSYNFNNTKIENAQTGLPMVSSAIGSNNTMLKGMYNIIVPKLIATSKRCPHCNGDVFIDTDLNRLKCYKCNKNLEFVFPDWHEDMVVTFHEGDRKHRYVYSWMYNAWVKKENAIFLTSDNLNTWVSKEIYEENQKKSRQKK